MHALQLKLIRQRMKGFLNYFVLIEYPYKRQVFAVVNQ